MARIYLSSTAFDLKDHREQVRLALRRLGHEDIAMEYYGATEEKPLDKCLQDVSNCDLYIGIFAWRYGYIPPGENKSITELEYRRAKALGKPCLIFLVSPGPWDTNLIEFEAKPRIDTLRKELSETNMVDFFSSSDDLATKVTQAVSQWEKKYVLEGASTYSPYEQKYVSQVAKRHSEIIPPSFSGERRRVLLNKLYIEPYFELKTSKQILSLSEFIQSISRTVVLGNPGGGKSTLTTKLVYDFSTSTSTLRGKVVLPILVVLREYVLDRETHKTSILDFIITKAKTDYQLEPPQDFFKNLLESGRTLVIFDGLDEILDIVHRQAIAQDIEAFCSLYPDTEFLITSRDVSYNQVPLDPKIFSIYSIIPFDQLQTEAYIQKWFTYVEELPEKAGQNVAQFLKELEGIANDISSNPLLLALICAIYQSEGDIPRNQADIYEKCASLLLEKRDTERKIDYKLPQKARLVAIVSHLAYWIYTNPKLNRGVTKKQLVAETTHYLNKTLLENLDEAEYVASPLIDYLINRAWIFTNIGTTQAKDNVYRFTHQPFLEYFTAKYLIRIHRTPKALYDAVRTYILQGEWNLVTQLAFQIISKDAEEATNTLIELVLQDIQEVRGDKQGRLLQFGIRCLAYSIPKRSIISTLIQKYLDFTLGQLSPQLEAIRIEDLYKGWYEDDYYPSNFFSELIELITHSLPENLSTIASSLEETLSNLILSQTRHTSFLASEMGINLSLGINWMRRSSGDNSRYEKWQSYFEAISSKLLTKHVDLIVEKLCPHYVLLAIDLLYRDKLSIQDLVNWHGTQCLFEEYWYIVYHHVFSRELVLDWLETLCYNSMTEETQGKYIGYIQQVAETLLPVPTPWLTIENTDNLRSFGPDVVRNKIVSLRLDSTALFGVFLILAFNYERWFNSGRTSLQELKPLIPDYILPAFVARFTTEKVEEDQIRVALSDFSFSPEQIDFVLKWASDQIGIIA